MKGDQIIRPCDRHSNETVTLRKHVTKYKNIRKLKVAFFRKFENRSIKIGKTNRGWVDWQKSTQPLCGTSAVRTCVPASVWHFSCAHVCGTSAVRAHVCPSLCVAPQLCARLSQPMSCTSAVRTCIPASVWHLSCACAHVSQAIQLMASLGQFIADNRRPDTLPRDEKKPLAKAAQILQEIRAQRYSNVKGK